MAERWERDIRKGLMGNDGRKRKTEKGRPERMGVKSKWGR
jgi:hypothetical protein